MDENKKLFLIQMKIFSKVKKSHFELNHESSLFCKECIFLSNYLMDVLPLDEILA